eukprot:TRINITY_DN6182_c0_g1_i1.p1 TRINITY_DN6182_c0_g1~~TRINITY_DN6182_c0_g1_i1.p1  ORF type:complete len:375 (+),score=114.78 TRINITY_DN6182_c0_g1_i1:43-1167(+)
MKRQCLSTAVAASGGVKPLGYVAGKALYDAIPKSSVALYGWNAHSVTRVQLLQNYFREKRFPFKGFYAEPADVHPDYSSEAKPTSSFNPGEKGIDSVIIGGRGAATADLVSKCLDNGKHVLLDRGSLDVAMSASDAKSLLQLAQKKEKVLMFPSFKRIAPHYVDALRNWMYPAVQQATKKIQVLMREDDSTVVLSDTKTFLKQHVFSDLDFINAVYPNEKLSVSAVAQAEYGLDVTLSNASGAEILLSYHVSCPKFLYKLVWNDNCVVRVEGLAYVFHPSGDYFADAIMEELDMFRDMMRDKKRREQFTAKNLQIVPKTLELIEDISNFPSKGALPDRALQQQSAVDYFKQLTSLRELGVGVDLDKVHKKKIKK